MPKMMVEGIKVFRHLTFVSFLAKVPCGPQGMLLAGSFGLKRSISQIILNPFAARCLSSVPCFCVKGVEGTGQG